MVEEPPARVRNPAKPVPSGAQIKFARPRAPLGGRDAIDRFVGWSVLALVVLMAVFVAFTSYQQDRSVREREMIISKLEEQNQDILCFADSTQSFEVVIADIWLAQQPTRSDPELEETWRQLQELRDELAAAKQLCVVGGTNRTPTTR